jgi:predicted nucleotidyltransferase component of viral defense system
MLHDLVQIQAEPIGETIDIIRSELRSLLGEPQRMFKDGLVSLIYKNVHNDGTPLKLKIEINSREHFAYLGFRQYDFKCESTFVSGEVSICSYTIEEILATKLRALYQRRKGCDLFDLHMAMVRFENLNCDAVVDCFQRYMDFGGVRVTQKVFVKNLEDKLKHGPFLDDIESLLPVQDNQLHPDTAYQNVLEKLIARLN